jgi:peptidoglycan-associated lipoprotein
MIKRNSIHLLTRIGLAVGLAALAPVCAAAQNKTPFEAGVNYTYVRSNASPGQCGCFSLNGGAGWVAFNFTHSFSAVAEVSGQHVGNPDNSGDGLNLVSYMFGPRYRRGKSRLQPFAQTLFGGSHANGLIATGGSGSLNAFAMTAGGGADVNLNRRLAFRVFEADYFLTRFKNGVNDHQNNLRISSGLVFRF